ncbi:MAG: magnesium protoporphyrin IX methyltransferase [Paracoccaceae bacterium]
MTAAMPRDSYETRRDRLRAYFDETARDAWARLTSDAPVSRIRATVRAGRDEMRARLLSWLPEDLTGQRVLDAGCGTGALSLEAAARGAEVVAVDIAPSLVTIAAERTPEELRARIDWRVGDMADPALGQFDHVIAMDSLIHYRPQDMAAAVARLARRSTERLAITFAPRTPLLTGMHLAGKLFPRSDRSPAIVPVSRGALVARLRGTEALDGVQIGRGHRVHRGFYISEALELVRP